MAPQKNQKLADIAGGTGDIAQKFIENGGESAYIIDINIEMIKAGKIQSNNKLHWIAASAEKIPIPEIVMAPNNITLFFINKFITSNPKTILNNVIGGFDFTFIKIMYK